MEAHSIGILSDRTRVRHPESHAHRQDDAAGDALRCIPCLPDFPRISGLGKPMDRGLSDPPLARPTRRFF